MRVPTKQIWTLKLQFTKRFQCWDKKRSCAPCTCTPKTLKRSRWQQSAAHINHKEYRRTGDFMACGSVNSVLRSVIFIQYFCNVQTCWWLQSTEAASCRTGHFYLHWTVNKQNILTWVTMSHCAFLKVKWYLFIILYTQLYGACILGFHSVLVNVGAVHVSHHQVGQGYTNR